MTQTKQHCSTPDQLLTFLRGQLSAREETDLQQHLDDCFSCRERLENTAADASVWNEAKEFFGNGALHTSARDSREEHEEANPGTLRIRQVLDTLGPTDDPESLGRIGGYEVTGVVGAGGMGVVLKAHDRSLDRIVAIKVMAPHLASSGSARKRFAREAKAAAAVLHPNVIAIHSVASEDADPYLVMPFVRGASLQRRIDSQGPLPLKDTLRIGAQIAAGLAAAHEQGLVHRDIKPANILLEEGVERVTITDFGLARAVDDASMTCSGVIAGTPQYMSPEQARGEPIDARSDLFSLGGVLYAMCTGRSPFRAETTYGVLHRIANDKPTPVCEVNSDVPTWLGHVIEQLMAKRPHDRFESSAKVAQLLEGCLAHVQQPNAMPLPEAVTALAPEKTRRPRIGKFIAAVVGVFGLLFAGILIVLELDKGTLTIESVMDDVPIRISQNDKVIERLTVSKSGTSVRVAAGTYVVELETKLDGMVLENNQVSLKRGKTEQIKIRYSKMAKDANDESSSLRFETPEALMKHIADCQMKDNGPGVMACYTDQPFKDLVPSYLLTSIMELQYSENVPVSKPRHLEELVELKQILAEEFQGNEAGKSLLALVLAHKEIADRSIDKFAEAAEATAESPLVQFLASGSVDVINARSLIMKLAALHEKYEIPDAKQEPKVYTYTIEQDGDKAVATEVTCKHKYGLIKTDAGWRIDDIFYGLKDGDASASVVPKTSESATAISGPGDSISTPDEKTKITVDVYGGDRALGQNNSNYSKLVQDLNAIDDVQVNFRKSGTGSDIALAIVRDPSGLMDQEKLTTGKLSARRDAITKALAQIPNTRWEEGPSKDTGEAVDGHSEIVPATINLERASNAVKRVMQYLLAVQKKDSETINSIAKGRAKDEKRENGVSTLLSGGGIPKLYKNWFLNQSAVVAFGPVSSSDNQMNGRFLLFTLSLVDERWSIVDIDLESRESIDSRLKDAQVETGASATDTSDSKSFEIKLHELDALRKDRKPTVSEVEKFVQQLAESYPNQLGRIHWHATHLYGQSGIKEFSDQVIANAIKGH